VATTLPTHGGRIRKTVPAGGVAANLADYDRARETFSWEQARGDLVALRWLSRSGDTTDIT